jgi:hypothetical protein
MLAAAALAKPQAGSEVTVQEFLHGHYRQSQQRLKTTFRGSIPPKGRLPKPNAMDSNLIIPAEQM